MTQPTVKIYSKQWITACNIAISMTVIICVVIGLFVSLAYRRPKNLQEAVGNIASFRQHDKEWYDYIGGATGNYFNVTLEDGTFFEATGIAYNNINRELFEKIRPGEEIKLTYSHGFGRPNRIYAIEYNGINYLPLDDVLAKYENEYKGRHIAGIVVIVLSVVAGGAGLFIVNYKYRKKAFQAL